MNIILRSFILICGVSMTVIIFYLLINKKINEKNSVLWIISSILILGLSAMPNFLDKLASVLGIDYPPALLFLITSLIFLVCILYLSVQISSLIYKVNKLAQLSAINNSKYEQKIKELEERIKTSKNN